MCRTDNDRRKALPPGIQAMNAPISLVEVDRAVGMVGARHDGQPKYPRREPVRRPARAAEQALSQPHAFQKPPRDLLRRFERVRFGDRFQGSPRPDVVRLAPIHPDHCAEQKDNESAYDLEQRHGFLRKRARYSSMARRISSATETPMCLESAFSFLIVRSDK